MQVIVFFGNQSDEKKEEFKTVGAYFAVYFIMDTCLGLEKYKG